MAPNSHAAPSELDFGGGKKSKKKNKITKKWPKGEEIDIEEASVKPVPAPALSDDGAHLRLPRGANDSCASNKSAMDTSSDM